MISPLDSRYKTKLAPIDKIWDVSNSINIKVMIEVMYFQFLCNNKIGILKEGDYSQKVFTGIFKNIWKNMGHNGYTRVEHLEKSTKHDIKAIEYFVKEQLCGYGEINNDHTEYVHLGLTSQDIVSLSYAITMKQSVAEVSTKTMEMFNSMNNFSKKTMGDVFIGKTHGQPAVPTSIGREMTVYLYRLQDYINMINTTPIRCKFGGAIGTLAANYYAFPKINWEHFMTQFVKQFGVDRSLVTTQVDNYETFCMVFDNYAAICDILIDMCRDIWQYISMDYFNIKIDKDKHVGSSTMPQKINPIKFENAEGNLEIAVMWFKFLGSKLRKSRLQRDLSDSTVMRNIGVAVSHMYLAISYITEGISELEVNESILKEELQTGYTVLAEAVQTKLRSEGYISSYEMIKTYFIGQKNMDKDTFMDIIDVLDIKDNLKDELKELTPETYYRDQF